LVVQYGGIVFVVASLSKAHAAYVADPPYDLTAISYQVFWTVVFVSVLAVAAYGAGLPDIPRTSRQFAIAAIAAAAMSAVFMSLVQLFLGDALLPRFVIFSAAVAVVPVYGLAFVMASGGRQRGEQRDRLLLVAPEDDERTLEQDLARRASRPASIVARLDPAAARGCRESHPVIDAVLAHRATVVVLGRMALQDDDVVSQTAALHEAGVRIRTLAQFYEQWLGKLPLSELERVSLFFDIGELHRARYGRWKRFADFFLALLLLPVLVLAIPVVWLSNIVGNRGPLFYRQERVGRNNAPFTILKFRTMTPGIAESKWTVADDPRITPVGRVLRKTHVDELPQVVNIIRGDLSLVGPRPEQPRYVRDLEETVPFYRLRHLVRPGLTGWAQVNFDYGASEEDAMEKLQYEFYYLRHQSLSLDAVVLVRTLRAALGATGR
jgi:lipopolysaccharide/colanic/teichoic acid biosynthesis glycosyltransferase